MLSVDNPLARSFYEAKALCDGWSVRQLDRQISTLFYERTALSRDKAAMLKKGSRTKPEDTVTPEEEIKDPFLRGAAERTCHRVEEGGRMAKKQADPQPYAKPDQRGAQEGGVAFVLRRATPRF